MSDIPQTRDKLIDKIDSLDLVNEEGDVLHELFGSIVMHNVHVHHLATAAKECIPVVFSIDEISDAGQNQSARENGLDVTPGHLQDNCKSGGNDAHQAPSTLDASAPFVQFGGIKGYIHGWKRINHLRVL